MNLIFRIVIFTGLFVTFIATTIGLTSDLFQNLEHITNFLQKGAKFHAWIYTIFIFIIFVLSCIIYIIYKTNNKPVDMIHKQDIEEQKSAKDIALIIQEINNLHSALRGRKTKQPFDYDKIRLKFEVRDNGDTDITYRYRLKTYSDTLPVWKSFTEGDAVETKIQNIGALDFKVKIIEGAKSIHWLPTDLSGVSFESCLFFIPPVEPNSYIEFVITMHWPNYFARLLKGEADDFWIVYLNRNLKKKTDYGVEFIFAASIPTVNYEVSGFLEDEYAIKSKQISGGKQSISFTNKNYTPGLYGNTKPKIILKI